MGKKATKKLLKKFKGGGADGKKIKGAKGPKVKKGVAKKDSKSVSLSSVLKGRKGQNLNKRKRRRPEKNENNENGNAKVKSKAFDVEAGRSKEDKDKIPSTKLEDMSLDEFLAGGFKSVINENSEAESDDESVAGEENNVSDDSDNEVYEEETKLENKNEKTKSMVEKESSEDEEDSDEETSHKMDLEKLKETDPEFYEHLKSNASELLDFGNEEEEEKSEKDETDDKGEEDSKESKLEPGQVILTSTLLAKLNKKAFEKKSKEGLREIVRAFKAGSHVADEIDPKKSKGDKPGSTKYIIISPTVLQNLMINSIRKFHVLMNESLKVKAGQLPNASSRWKRQERLVKGFLSSILHLLNNSTDPSMLKFVLQNCKHYGTFFACFPDTICKKYLKSLLRHFGSSEDGVVRISAFLRIRQLAVEAPKYVDKCMKGAYLTFVREAKYAKSELTAERIAIQAKCLVELFGVDLVVAYQLAFVYIRQLALHLRSALLSKSKESVQSVYCWQFVHCLKLWGVVLSSYPGANVVESTESKKVIAQHNQQLRPLIYPLVQVVTGTIRLVPSSQYFPLRIHLLNVLNSLSRASKFYIPSAPYALEILQTSELFDRKPIASTKKIPDLDFTLRFKKKEMLIGGCQQAIMVKTLTVLENYFECYRLSVGFPEMIYPAVVVLRSFARKTRVTKWRTDIRALIAKVTKWADAIKTKRSNATFGPANVSRAAAFSTLIEREDHERMMKKKNEVDQEVTTESLMRTTTHDQGDDKVIDMSDSDDDDDSEAKDGEKTETKPAKKQKVKHESKPIEGNDDVVGELELSSSEDED